jgi:hypothetical protein
MYIGPHIKYPLFLCSFNENEFSRHSLEKYLNINVQENPLIRRRVVPCGQTADMRNLIVTFSNCADAPKKKLHSVFSFISMVQMTPILNGDFISGKHSPAGPNSYNALPPLRNGILNLIKFIKFYSHQLKHFHIQPCISLLSYIKIT